MGVVFANSMSWEEKKALLIEEYIPRDEVQNLEHELWNLKIGGSDIMAYTIMFNDLVLLCVEMVNPKYKKV